MGLCMGSIWLQQGKLEKKGGGEWEMTHVLMKTHNDSCTPVLILHETKPNVVRFSCMKSKAEIAISF